MSLIDEIEAVLYPSLWALDNCSCFYLKCSVLIVTKLQTGKLNILFNKKIYEIVNWDKFSQYH